MVGFFDDPMAYLGSLFDQQGTSPPGGQTFTNPNSMAMLGAGAALLNRPKYVQYPWQITNPAGAAIGGAASGYQQGQQNQSQGLQNAMLSYGLPKAAFTGNAFANAAQQASQGGQSAQGYVPSPGMSPGGAPMPGTGQPAGDFAQGPGNPGSGVGAAGNGQAVDFFGNPLLPGLTPQQQMMMQITDPVGYKARVDATWHDVRPGGFYRDPSTGQMTQAPAAGITGVPGFPGQPDYNQNVTKLGVAQQAPKTAAELQTMGYGSSLKTGQPPAGGGITGTGVIPPGETRLQRQQRADGGQSTPAASGKDIQTDRGTIVPSSSVQVLKQGELPFSKQLDNSTKTEENWNMVRPSIETSRQRLSASAAVFQAVEGKGYNEHKADLANNLRGIPGMSGIANMIQSGADTAKIKEATWYSMQEALASLKAINAGTGGRILNSEFNAFMEHGFSADMPADTLRKAVTAQLGTTYQIGNMIDDYNDAGMRSGWLDANQFQSHYLRRNPVENFINYADKSLAPFKGQTGTSVSVPLPGAYPPPSPAAIKHLQMTPNLTKEFDAIFGPGAAAKALGR